MMSAPNRSALLGPMPEMVSSCGSDCGHAMAILRRIASLRTMKAGLPVLAASDLRHARRLAASCSCAGVRLVDRSCADLRFVDFALRLRAGRVAVSSDMAGRT